MTQHGSFPGRPRGRRAREANDVPEWQGDDATPQDQREVPDRGVRPAGLVEESIPLSGIVFEGRLPSNERWGTSQSGVPPDLTSSGVLPNESASLCAITFASRRS